MLLLNFTAGIWLGVRQALHKDGRVDRWLTTLSLAGYATPSFWLGLVFAGLVGVRWHLLPPAGMQIRCSRAAFPVVAMDVLATSSSPRSRLPS